ncbi:MAG: chaperone NapD [Candidatus Bipolaricaulota bacterium]|nr:chaperone NapD [Candidatus Bipolaricaulota bacterium]MCS7274149.1 chaperone NapD [Candidatus Bipolaricaulota bacterium]
MQRSWVLYLLWALTLAVVAWAIWYIASSPRPEPPATPTYSRPTGPLHPEDYPKLEERILSLIAAPDPALFAKENGLEKDFKDGKLLVVIEAQSTDVLEELRWAIEALDGTLEGEFERSLQVRLPLAMVLKLAKHPHIEFIRLPVRPEPG